MEIDYIKLYKKEDKHILKLAEDSLNPSIDRIQEIIEYCKLGNIKRIGIANCVAFTKEADALENILITNGFTVSKVNCKLGKVPFTDLVPGYKGVSCNPVGQAIYLAEHKTDFNIMMGLCLGHDMIFNKKSEAPVTPLVVKDRKLKHQTLQLLSENKN